MGTGSADLPTGRVGDGLRYLDLKVGYTTSDQPVENFYIPVLSRATELDRMAGYFSSGSLALAARGLAGLIRNGGRMRLLVGTDLKPEDIQAIEQGESLESVVTEHLLALLEGRPSELEKERLKALSWMVADGTLQIRVVVPRPGTGYFHSKNGIATDHRGDRIAWQGSNNETPHGWINNYEQFSVFNSWDTEDHVKFVEGEFQQAWSGRLSGYITLPIPEAARRKLLQYRPQAPPDRDPEEPDLRLNARQAVIARWLRDVPHLLGMEGRIGPTAAIRPWPHQRLVADQVVSTFPERYLLADEVGLGKTIEVGLVLRDLVLSERVRRCLILAPASVLRQWQEELWEKFGMAFPRYEGGKLIDPSPGAGASGPGAKADWLDEPMVLVSSQLAKRKERRAELWERSDWDMVVVDEVHHARRKGHSEPRRRPNRLLELLEGVGGQPGLVRKTRGLLLLTATPMQVHPIEVWDLLIQLGLPGRWGADETNFLRYFQELRRAAGEWEEVNWRLVGAMASDELRYGGPVHREIEQYVKNRLGWAGWERLRRYPDRPGRIADIRDPGERAALLRMFGHLTPLRRRMHRNTRQLLREYRDRGILDARLAERRPQPRWVTMSPPERALYDRVEEYISDFYARYEGRRRGLGFVMTVYRRRLTSSLHALEQSLRRRLEFLRGESSTWATDEDLEEDDLQTDVSEEIEDDPSGLRSLYAEEIGYVEDFLGALGNLGTDTKYARLADDISRALARRPNLVIFTQYTDTMDYLREHLRAVYGHRIACYSGRGGERWTGAEWEQVGKEQIKGAFRDGEIQILLGTDAMAEGLNLQSCGVEINYDVPWNPMRLEQRIGRVDRIGQRFPTVWIWNYFLEDTIEAEVYRRLMDRIDWFQSVVGALQPILHRVDRTIRSLAMQTPAQRRGRIEQELAEIADQVTAAEGGFDPADHLTRTTPSPPPPPPAIPDQLRRFFTESSLTLQTRLRPHPDLPGAYRVRRGNRDTAVTFSPDLARRHPDTLRLLTFGDPLFEQLLGEVDDAAPSRFGLVRLQARPDGRRRIGWYRNRQGRPALIGSMSELEDALDRAPDRPALGEEAARDAFDAQLARETDRRRRAETAIADEQRSALLEEARRLLARAACTWAARRANLLAAETASLPDNTIEAMAGAEGYPWAGLLALLGAPSPPPPDAEQWQEASTLTDRQLQARHRSLKNRAELLLHRLAAT